MVLGGCNSADERAQSHYDRGLEYAANGEPVKAGLEFRNALKLRSNFVPALFELGKAEEQQGRFDSAARIFRSVTEQSQDHVRARIRLAYILLAAGQLDAASKYADEAGQIAKESPEALVVKAAIELKRDNRGTAIRLSQAALERDPELVDALMVLASERLLASKPAEALSFLNRADSPKSERNIGLQVLRLTALEALDNQPGVEQLFEKLTQLFPDNPAFRQGLVKWYLSKGRKDDARLAARRFATENAGREDAQFFYVTFLNSVDGPDAAIAQLQSLISAGEIDPKSRFNYRMALGRFLFTAGRGSEATELMQSIIEKTDDLTDKNKARVDLARMAATTKQWDEAERLTDDVLADDANNVGALSVRATVRFANGKNAEAIEDVRAALNEAPQDARLYALLAEAREREGSVVLAQEAYAKALTLEGYAPDLGLRMARFLLRYGKTEQAHNVLENVRARTPGDKRVLTLLAQLSLASRDWVGAQQIADTLNELEKGGESEPTADKIRAAALSGLNKHTESIALLQASLNSADKPEVLGDLIRAYVQAGRQDAAEEHLKSLIETEPGNVQAHILLGTVYATMGQGEDAEKSFRAAVDADSGVLGQTALAQYLATVGRPDEAETVARNGLQQDSNSVALRLLLAGILHRSTRFEEAIAEYEILFAADPNSTIVANDLASLLSERRGGPEALDRAFSIAQRFRNSEIPHYMDTLGWIHYLRGEYPQALPLLRTAAERLPDNGLVQYHLGMVLKQLGQNELSIASLERAASMLAATDLEKAKTELEQLRSAAPAASE